jgi:hypothetical protein
MSLPAGPAVAVEEWIVQRLREPTLFDGVTTADERKQRVRAAILGRDAAAAIAGKRPDASCETWTDLFQRVYGEPLQ